MKIRRPVAVTSLIIIIVVVGAITVGWHVKRSNHALNSRNDNQGNNGCQQTNDGNSNEIYPTVCIPTNSEAGSHSATVQEYDDCTKAKGSYIEQSYPAVCVTAGGKRYTNPRD